VTQRWPVFILMTLVLLVSCFAAAQSGPTPGGAGPAAVADGALRPIVTTSELVVGPNRLAFGLLKDHTLLEDAEVLVRVYELVDQQPQLRTEVAAAYERLKVIAQGQHVHIHPDGSPHVHSGETDIRGLYVTHLTFARPGTWGLELLAKPQDGPVASVRFAVDVLATPHTPAPGAPAPPSHNRIASDVSDLRQIDSSDPPDPRLHQVRIADAIAQGKPQVIVFASPRLCTTRLCGPVVDVVRTLIPLYGDRVVFTHEEIWQDAAGQQLSPTVVEWRLQSEPWIFVVDGQGIVQARFEGLTTERELEAAVKRLLAQP
jgi:hypothetical protein